VSTTEHIEAASYNDSTDGHVEAGHHSDLIYVKVFGLLVVLTAVEVALSYVDVGKAFLPAMIALMLVKFVMVIFYFMHLKFETAQIFKRLFYVGLVGAVVSYLAVLTTFQFWSN
jgi:cytochrome c oxidase subunit 4